MKKTRIALVALILFATFVGTAFAADNTLYLFTPTTGATMTTKLDHPWVNRGDLWKVLMFRSLFLPDPTLTTVSPDLASSYQISSDGLTYTITMKKGASWHDGTPVTADDVVFSIQTALKAAQVNAIYTGVFSHIVGASDFIAGKASSLSGLTAKGDVITMKLDAKVGNAISVLGQFAIMPKHLLKDVNPLEFQNASFWAHPIGNGMYKLQEFNPGNYAVFVPYEKYDGPKPKIERIVLTAMADPIVAAQSGKLDLYNTNATDQISEFNKMKGFTAYPVDITFYRYFVQNIKDANGVPNKTMSDIRVRKAIMYAMDTKAIAEGLYPGLAKLIYTGVPTSHSAYDKSSEVYSYDPEKAKQLLKEANFDFSKPLKLRFYYADQTSINFMTAIAQYLAQVGIKTDVQKFQGDATTELYKVKDYDIALKGLSAFGFEEWYGEYASDNVNFVNILGKDGYFDAKVNELRETTDPVKRNQILVDLQKLEQKYLYKLPLFILQNIYYVNTAKVKTPGIFGNPWYNWDYKFQDWEIK
ncbi:MAG: ABC transporter substrate-binding protein [Treponema sp.]|jgi:peptide/nickel transport system substrate-binding protein|nr:ABC transporter substrate-binding protein [Spirochaetota bacterium]NLH89091.1 ABC transporter substrate-binding protein [Treponema sp.]HNP93829.1 ABC transporter substrate-binding protein [Rectinema sp.]HQC17001.1 ABC transporter substrate-binding protein [Rectinema sp.]